MNLESPFQGNSFKSMGTRKVYVDRAVCHTPNTMGVDMLVSNAAID